MNGYAKVATMAVSGITRTGPGVGPSDDEQAHLLVDLVFPSSNRHSASIKPRLQSGYQYSNCLLRVFPGKSPEPPQ